MINKKISVLAAAVFAASAAQATFDVGNAVFVSVDLSTENQARYVTTVVDLGVSAQSIYDGNGFADVAVGTGHSAWTILGVVRGTTTVSGFHPHPNPAFDPDLLVDNGILAAGTGSSTATNAQILDTQDALDAWISGINGLDTDNDGVVVTTNSQAQAFNSGMLTWGHDYGGGNALVAAGASEVSAAIVTAESTAAVTAPTTINSVLAPVSYDAVTGNVSAVPVPAAAWLFGSALAGLTVVRRRK